ncbi:MAG: signal peptidase II [Alphaproteobacteria bacterium]
MVRKLSISKKNLSLILPIVAGVILFDQLSKKLVIDYLQAVGVEQKINNFFNLVLIKNTGMGFGFLQDYHLPPLIIIFLTALVALVALVVFWGANGLRLKVALSIALAGGISNGVDRVVHGGVIDFLDFHYGNFHWPSFNFADSAISIAIFLLFLEIISNDGRRKHRINRSGRSRSTRRSMQKRR